MQIELRHLRFVIAAAEHGSFRRAAAAMGVQESAVSRRIRDLEDEIGVALFHRHHSGVMITYAGRKFLAHARKAVSQVGNARKDAGAAGRGEVGVVRIGLFSSLASGFLAELFQAYYAGCADVQLDFVEGGLSDHLAAIQQHQLDIAFLTGTLSAGSYCEMLHLWDEQIFAVLPHEHSLARKENLEWTDLAGERFIVSDIASGQEICGYLIQRLADLGRQPEVQWQNVGRDNLLPLVALGHGVTLAVESTTRIQMPGIAYRPIVGEVLPFSAIWSPRNDNPACRRLLSLARSMARSGKAALNSPTSTMKSSVEPSQTPDPSR